MAAPDLSDGKEYWQYRYSEGHTEWQVDQVYPMLVRNYEKMVPDGKAKKVFYPMCGTSLELEWLVQQGATVVGVEIAMQAIETYVSNSTQKWTNSDVPELGSAAKVFTRDDKKMKLYCTDIQEFSPKLEGKFDAIYDRGSLQFVPPENVSSYAEVLKSLLKPKGRILQEVLEYDLKIFEDQNLSMKVPPPYTMNTDDVKKLFEPDCSVEKVETYKSDRFFGNVVDFHVHIITKD